MKQLFANNAKAILASPIGAGDLTITVDDGSKFPLPGPYEYFMITIELSGVIEVIMVTSRVGNIFTIGGLGRGCEGTTANAFSAGARVEVRITKDSLDRKSTQLYPIASLDNVVPPREAYSGGYVAGSYDPFGNPALLFAKDALTWRFFNYTQIGIYAITTSTTTSATAGSIILNNLTPGKYIVQFTSGIFAGYVRQITSVADNTITWSTPLPLAPAGASTFEILEANISILQDAITAVSLPCALNTGTTNNLNAVYFPILTGFTDNQVLAVVLTTPNTSGTVTFSPNALSPKPIVGREGEALRPGDLYGTILLRYDQTTDKWFLVNGMRRKIDAISYFIGNF